MEERLIEAVRARTILYDTTHRDYMRTKLKSEKWEEVAGEADLKNGATAKCTWEKLRHAFRDALRRQKRMKRSGVPAEAIKIWKYQKQMGFLQPFMANRRRRQGNLKEETDSDGDQSPYVGSPDCALKEEQQSLNIIGEDDDSAPSPSTSVASSITLETAAKKPPATRTSTPIRKKAVATRQCTSIKKNSIATLMKHDIETHQQISAQRSEEGRQQEEMKASQDPLYHFFISMYETTKRMPPASQYTVRNEIYQAVSNMEATLLGIPEALTSETQHYNNY